MAGALSTLDAPEPRPDEVVIEVNYEQAGAQESAANGASAETNGEASVFDLVSAHVEVQTDDLSDHLQGQNDAILQMDPALNDSAEVSSVGSESQDATPAMAEEILGDLTTNLETDSNNLAGEQAPSTATPEGVANPIPAQLVETLHAANGPPEDSLVTAQPLGGVVINVNENNAQLFGNELIIYEGETLKGTGSLGLSVVNSGLFSPGNSPAVTNYSNYTQTASGEELIEIGGTAVGTQYDQVQVSALATLDGLLRIQLISGFVPTAGQNFTVMTWASRVGEFANYLGTAEIGGDLAFVPVYTATSLILHVVSTTSYNPYQTQIEGLIQTTGQVADVMDTVGSFAHSLPFIDAKIGDLADTGSAITSAFLDKLNDLSGTISQADVTAQIEDMDGLTVGGFTMTVNGVLGNYGATTFWWDVDITFSRSQTVTYDLGEAPFGATLSGAVTGSVTATFNLDFSFGRDATGYFIGLNDAEARVQLNTSPTFSVTLGAPLSTTASVTSGTANLDAGLTVTPNAGILTGGRIYLNTLEQLRDGALSMVTNFTYTPTSSLAVDLQLNASTANLGGTVSLSGGANARLQMTSADLFTTDPDVDFEFQNATLSLGASFPGFQGNFSIFTDGTKTYIDATITSLKLMVGATRVLEMSGTASFVLADGEVAGKADLTFVNGPALADLTITGGTWRLELNTGEDDAEVPYGSETVTLPGGNYLRIEADGAGLSFTINPTFTLNGNFVFEQNGSVVAVGASEVSFNFGDDTHPNLISVTDGAGILVIKNSGLAGSLTATVSESIPVVDFGGTFTVLVNDTGALVNETVTVDGETETVYAELGNYLRIEGIGTTLGLQGVTLTGDFVFENRNTSTGGEKAITVGAQNVNAVLGTGTADLVSLTNGSGGFIITNDGMAGSATVTYSLSVPALTLSTAGTATLVINQTSSPVNESIQIGSNPAYAISAPEPGPYLRIEAIGATFSLLGNDGVNISGDFSYEQYETDDGDPVVKVAAENAAVTLGDASNANLLSLTNANGYFYFNEDGMAGSAEGTLAANVADIVSLTGTFALLINTTSEDVEEDFTINASTVTLEAPAGPYVRISGTGVELIVSVDGIGSVEVDGDFVFEQQNESDGTAEYIKVGGRNVAVQLSAVGVTVTASGGTGGFLLTTAGLAGEASMDSLLVTGVPGVAFSASNIKLRLNSTGATVASTTVDVSDTESVTFEFSGSYYEDYVGISAALDVSITAFASLHLTGNFSFELYNPGSGNVVRLAASDAAAEFKFGSDDPLISFHHGVGAFVITDQGVAGTATLEFQTGFVSVSGTIKLEINTTNAAASYSWTAPDASSFTINLTAGPFVRICVNGHVIIGSVTLPLDFEILEQSGALYFRTKPGGVNQFHLDPDGSFHLDALSLPTDIDFANPSPEDILTFIQRIANWFGLLKSSSLFQVEIPFTDGLTLEDAFDWSKAFIDLLYNKLVVTEVGAILPTVALPVSGAYSGSFSIAIGSESAVTINFNGNWSTGLSGLVAAINVGINASALTGRIVARINRNEWLGIDLTETEMLAGSLMFNLSGATGAALTAGFSAIQNSAAFSRFTLEQFPYALSRILGIAGAGAPTLTQWPWLTELPSLPTTILSNTPITYDPTRKLYIFPVNLTYTPTPYTVDFDFGQEIGPLGEASLTGQIQFAPSLSFTMNLGLDLNAAEVPRIVSSQSIPAPSNGRISQNLTFSLYLNNALVPITVTLLKSATDANTSVDDLVADLNLALYNAADYVPTTGPPVDLLQLVVFQKAGPVIALSVLQEDVDADGVFDLSNEDTNGNGLLDSGEDVNGDGHLDINEDLNGDGNQDLQLGLINQIKIESNINSVFATELGFGDELIDVIGGANYGDEIYRSVANAGMKGFFFEDVQLGASLTISTPGTITGTLVFGFLKVSITGGTVQTQNPYTGAAAPISASLSLADPDTGSTRFYMAELFDVLTDVGTFIDGPNLTGSLYVGFTGVSATLGSQTVFSAGEISIWVPVITELDYNPNVYNISDSREDNNVGVFLTYPNIGLGGGYSFEKISFTDVIQGLEAVVDTLSDFSAFSFLDEKIPFINVSLHDLVDYAGQFADLIEAIGDADSGSVQDLLEEMESSVESLFHLSPDSFDINLDTNGINYGLGGTVSSGGGSGTHASFSFNPNGYQNGFTVTSVGTGSSWNNATLRVVGDPALTGNTSSATWDADAKILTILIDAGNTDAAAIVAAINSQVAAYWSAALITTDVLSGTSLGTGKVRTNSLKFSFHFTAAYAQSMPLQVNIVDLIAGLAGDNAAVASFLSAASSLVHVEGSGMLNVSASANATLDFGLDLTNPDGLTPFLYDSTGVSLTAKVTGTNLEFEAAIGALGVFIRQGEVTFDYDGKGGSTAPATIVVGLKDRDGDGRHYFDSSLLSLDTIGIEAHGGLTAVLPLFAPTETLPIGSEADANLDGFPDNALAVDIPDLIRLLLGDTTSQSVTGSEEVVMYFRGNKNDLVLTSTGGATGVKVTFKNQDGLATPTVSYSAGTNELTFTIDSGNTTASQLLALSMPAGFGLSSTTTDGGVNNGSGTLAKLILAAPDLNNLFAELDLCDLIDSATGPFLDALDETLGDLQEALEKAVLNVDLPLIGDGLQGAANFIDEFRNGLLAELRSRIDAAGGSAIGAIEDAIKEAIWKSLGPEGLDLLVNTDGSAFNEAEGFEQLAVTLDCDNGLFVDLRLNKTLALLDTTQNPIDFQIGVDGFGLEVDGNVVLSIGFDLRLAFGFNKQLGFFLDTSDDNELELDFEATIPGLHAGGELFFLQLDVSDDASDPSHFTGGFFVDLTDPGHNDDKLSWAEITSSGTDFEDIVHGELAAEAVINLELVASFGGDARFPRILADFHLDWSWTLSSGASTPVIEFRNVMLDVGSFVSDVLGPIVEKIKEIIDPIKPILDMVTARIPIISDLAGKTITFLDLAEGFGYLDPGTRQFIEQAIKIIDLISDIPTGTGTILIPIGSFSLGQGEDGSYSETNPLGNLDVGDLEEAILNGMDSASTASSTQITQTAGFVGEGGLGSMDNFQFPFIQNPSELFGLFTGAPVRLVEWQMPTFKFEFTYTQKIPIYPPLYAQFGGSIGAELSIGFGYDTYGIQKFIENGSKDVGQIFDGFYIADFDADGNERPEVTLKGSIFAGVSLNLGVAEVGVNGGIEAVITFDLNDAVDDGRIRISELIANATLDPRCIFDIHGELKVFLEAFLRANLLFFKIDKTWRFGEFILFQFDSSCPEPVLAENVGGVLYLNIGSRAGDRLEYDTADGDETLVVVHVSGDSLSETVEVQWRQWKMEFSGITKIYAEAGQGNDYIDLQGTLVESEIHLGAGNDTLYLGLGPNSKAYGDAGKDTIIAQTDDAATPRNTDNEIHGGDDSDTLAGPTNTKVTIYGDNGTDTITGSSGDDYLDGGEGSDTITGNAGNDDLFGGSGNDLIYGNDGDDTIDAGAGNDVVEAGWGDDSANGGSGDDTVYGSDGHDKIAGGSGNDSLYGHGGSDLIVGDEFDLASFTSDLSTAASAGGSFTIANITGTGHDLIVGGGSFDVLFGGDGDDFVFGGNFFNSSDTQIIEEDDNDFMDGGRGADQLFGDDSLGKEGDRVTGIEINSLVWHDLDLDGIRDAGEIGLANVKVQLFKASDNSLFTETLTDSAGRFKLSGLDPLDYYVVFTAPSGFIPTLANIGDGSPLDLDDDAEVDSDSDIDASGQTIAFQMDYDEIETTITAGFTGDPKITVTAAAVNEGGSGSQTSAVFVFTLSGPSRETIKIDYSTSDGFATTVNSDYLGATGTLSFAPGETSKSVSIAIYGDDTYERNEDFTLTAVPQIPAQLDGTPASVVTTVVIINDDAVPQATITDTTVVETEGSVTATLKVRLSNPSYQSITLDYLTSAAVNAQGESMGTSATPGIDFTVVGPVTLTFVAGDVEKTLTFTVSGDSIDEYDESFFVTLFNPSNATITDSLGVVVITDNDAAPTVTIAPLSPDGVSGSPLDHRTTVHETDDLAVSATFNVVVSGTTEKTITIRWDAARGTAISDSWDALLEPVDFTNNATADDLDSADADSDTTLIFEPGGPTSQSITVWVQPDDKAESDEFFYVNLFNAENAEVTGNHGVVRIVDDDSGPAGPGYVFDVRFSRPDFHTVEGDVNNTAYVTLIRSSAVGAAYTVLSVSGGTAAFGTDYTAGLNRIMVAFAPGETVQQVAVTIIGDNIHENDETVNFSLLKPTGEPVHGFPGTATLVIVDDDNAGIVVSTTTTSVVEGTPNYKFTITLVDFDDPAHPAMTAEAAVTFSYTTQGLTASNGADYSGFSGSWTFDLVNGNTKDFYVNTLGDAAPEYTEAFRFKVTGITSGEASLITSFKDGYITDDDPVNLSGYIFQDTNANGYWDSTESAFSNVAVTVTDSTGSPQALTTNGSGKYTASVLLGSITMSIDEATSGVTLEGWAVTTDNDSQDIDFTGGASPLSDVGYLFAESDELPSAAETTGRGGTDDTIFGGPGDDYIDAGAGDDHVVGGHWMTATDNNTPINQGLYSATIIANIGAATVDPQTDPIWSISTTGLGTASISGQIWVDTNNSNTQDEGLFTSEVVVFLMDGDGNVVQVVATTSGSYTFSGLYAGKYIVQFELPDGQQFVTPGIGGAAVNSDAIVAGRTDKLELATDTSALNNIDAGLESSGTLPVASGSTIQFSASSFHVSEAQTIGDASIATITVVRSNASKVEAFAWFTQDGTAISPTNYSGSQGVVVFQIGETLATFDIEITSTGLDLCTTVEFYLSLRKPTGQPISGGEATVYIHGYEQGTNTDDDIIDGNDDWDVILADSGWIDADALPNTASTKTHDVGGLGYDTVNGGDGPDYINGQLGDDNLAGNEGSDIVLGGYGDDRIMAELDDDLLNGQHGTDTVQGTWDGTLIYLSPTLLQFSADSVLDLADSQFALLNIEKAELFGGFSANSFQINGWTGEAFLFGDDGEDSLEFTNDVNMTLADATALQTLLYQLLYGYNVEANLTLSTGTAYHFGEFESVYLGGGASANTLDASNYTGAVSLEGLAGDDHLIGGTSTNTYLFNVDNVLGTDTITGSPGLDILDFSATLTNGVTVQLATLGVAQTVSAGQLSLILTSESIENVIGGHGNDDITGNSLDNVLVGGPGNDTLRGAAGSETYSYDTDSDWGSDTIVENLSDAGTDTLDFSSTSSLSVTIDLASTALQMVNGNLDLTLQGGGIENLIGGDEDDDLRGNTLNNIIRGGAGDDLIFGATGDDALDGGTGDDVLDGGNGADSIDMSADTNFVLANGILTRGSETDTLASIEEATLRGGDSSNTFTLTGWTGTASIYGNGGTDTLIFQGDVDMTLTGAGGIDTLSLNAGAYLFHLDGMESYQLTGGTAANVISVSGYTSGGQVTLDGADGDDTLVGSSGPDVIRGGAGNDILTGGGGYDSIIGGSGTDTQLETGSSVFVLSTGYFINGQSDSVSGVENLTITGTSGPDSFWITGSPVTVLTLIAGPGADMLFVSSAGFITLTNSSLALTGVSGTIILSGFNSATLYGSSADNDINASGFSDSATLYGYAGQDTLRGGSGPNTLDGGEGDDTYVFDTDSFLGTDTIVDSSGADTLDFSLSALGVAVNLGLTANLVNANLTLNWAAGVSVENLIGGSGGDTLTGTSGANRITGGGSNDTLDGAAGNDTYLFDTDNVLGTDTISDASGNDTLDFSASIGPIFIDLASTSNIVVTGRLTLSWAAAVTLENVVGTASADQIRGNSADNKFTSNGGADDLRGLGGNDTYVIEADLFTSATTVQITDSAGIDTVDFSLSATDISMNLATVSNIVTTHLSVSRAVGTVLENLTGGQGNDTLRGNTSGNILTGGAGNDTLDGAAGNDTYAFDADSDLGSDTIQDASGNDTLDFSSTTADISVNLSNTSNVVNDHLTLNWLTSVTLENVTGGSGDDLIIGNDSSNTLSGGAGADTIEGRGGTNSLIGGLGSDTFLFDWSLDDADTDSINIVSEIFLFGGTDDTLIGAGGTLIDLTSTAVQTPDPVNHSGFTLQILSANSVEHSL